MKKTLLLCLALSLVFFFVTLASAAGKSETVKGWVTDTKCAAKGMSESHADCAKKCIGAGEKMALVTDKDQKLLTVSNPDALEGHEGHHVRVKGEVSGDSITVDKGSVKMLAAKGKSDKGSAMDDMHK
ncbi:MAG TPA: hypothetical protein VFI95_09090 [Terriglobales bacterium]|nr:hypothetical protein [Terriglobales bacterium]